MPKHEDLTDVNCGWNPPEDWKFGICRGCGIEFLPRMHKQFWCSECRTANGPIKLNFKAMNQRRLGINERHPIAQAVNEKGFTVPQLVEMTGLNIVDIRRLARYSFVSPPKYPLVSKLCQTLSTSVDQLFPMARSEKLEKYKLWEAEHGPRHTLP